MAEYYYGVCRDVLAWRPRCAPLVATAVSPGELMTREVSKYHGTVCFLLRQVVDFCKV